MKLTKYAGNPILSPKPEHTWESLAVCNPGAWYENGTYYLLYRAAGDDEKHVIRFGLATSRDGFNFQRAGDEPIFSPSVDGPDAGCIEDARIVKLDGHYFITYAFRPYPPGRYWENPGNSADSLHAGFAAAKFVRDNLTNSGLLLSDDLRHFQRLGRITQSNLDDRDVILFPEKIGDLYYMLHRPKEWVGEAYGTQYPAIWINRSRDLLEWDNSYSRLLITGVESWERKIGGSSPPLKTERGWLTFYHGVDEIGIYRVGALLLDLEQPAKVIARTKDYLMEPEFDYEFNGLYKGCVFPTGNMIVDGTVYVYYGGSDVCCCVATARLDELLDYLIS